jgi:hypothetical protein
VALKDQQLVLEYLNTPREGKWFRLMCNLNYVARGGMVIIVPAGTYTDFASIPRGLRWLIPRVGDHGKAAVVHDYLCDQYNVGIGTRRRADRIFLEAMVELGVGRLKRRIMYSAVRAYSIATFQK